MLFEIDKNALSPYHSTWVPGELELEKYLITSADTEAPTLVPSVFGEPLLLISNQVKTRAKKRADILALDRGGNGVIVELKRDKGSLGVETQALQYLADFSNYKGHNFIKRFSKDSNNLEDNILSFMGGNPRLEDINKNSRIILVARSFDPTVYSMGEWLSDKGVSFRCIEYTPLDVDSRRFLSFSVAFDRSPESIFPLSFSSSAREPGIFWHNIARANNEWWNFLVQEGQIPACFDDEPGDQGERILTSYISGDKIVAYAKGHGAVGWGVIEKPESYKLIETGCSGDRLHGECLHRLTINWKATADDLSEGIKPDVIREQFEIYHPLSTSVAIDTKKGLKLLNKLTEKFKNKAYQGAALAAS
ncbi:MAG: hypothetical protein WC856_05120 [Methylococcaceae bacterium]|jgi:hypothetical protein